jgi:hypothetical protein
LEKAKVLKEAKKSLLGSVKGWAAVVAVGKQEYLRACGLG